MRDTLRGGRDQWAELMRRTFGVDVLACPRCGGRLRLVALIEQASVNQRVLRHLGLPTDVPEPRHAPHGRPLAYLWSFFPLPLSADSPQTRSSPAVLSALS